MKRTKDLEQILAKTPVDQIETYLKRHKKDLIKEFKPFAEYMTAQLKKKKIKKQDVFLYADIPEGYGYKLLNEEKRTRQRDVILRLCYAGAFSLEETQKALKIYGMPQLYAKIPRDAVLIICFNERPGSILEVNELLKEYKMEPLWESGKME